MDIGTVTGSVWGTRKVPGLSGLALLVVRTEAGPRVAADALGAGKGDRVLLSFGSAARLCCDGAPVDASVVAILDQGEVPYVGT